MTPAGEREGGEDGTATAVRVVCDLPADGAEVVGSGVQAHGWAHAPGGLAELRITLNGEPLGGVVRGVARPDVAEALGDPSAHAGGWTVLVPLAACRPGANELRVAARAVSGALAEATSRFRWRPLGGAADVAAWVDHSGERYDPRSSSADAIAIEHRARYAVAAALAPGRRVLDAGCGLGYGALALARAGAASVHGIDAHAAAIARARAQAPELAFAVGDIRRLPYADASFDLVVCLEVLEHIEEHDRLLAELRRVLAPDGLLVVSSPNRGVYPAGNPWHLRELTTGELAAALRARFRHVALLRQQLHLASVIDGEGAAGDGGSAALLRLGAAGPGTELYAVAVAGDGPLPAMAPLVALGDAGGEASGVSAAAWAERALRAEAEADRLRDELLAARRAGARTRRPAPPPEPALPAGQARARLAQELAAPPRWMYDWRLPGLGRPDVPASLTRIHQTRLALLEPAVRAAIAAAGAEGASVLDLACSEGWFAHRMLDWGARRVVGVDLRAGNVRRARLVRDHLGVAPGRLQLIQADVHDLPELGTFDVVLMLGLVYHLEDPMGAMRIARGLTRSLCVVESQLTDQHDPIRAGNGTAGQPFERAESFAAWFEDEPENPVASAAGVLSLIPNAAALLAMGRVAGFGDVALAAAEADHEPQYVLGERAVMIARPG